MSNFEKLGLGSDEINRDSEHILHQLPGAAGLGKTYAQELLHEIEEQDKK